MYIIDTVEGKSLKGKVGGERAEVKNLNAQMKTPHNIF